ncbi:MAG: hypothetical protein JNG89_19585 [Planctomycetaceae bacterium]|nr:hypothetical protein [Planctomycetaceae bacterium]
MSDRWLFQIDGKRYGPVAETELERFLAPPRLCKFMEVRRDGNGEEWISIGPKDDLQTALKRLGVVLPPKAPEPAPAAIPAAKAKVVEAAPPPAVAAPAPAEPRGPGIITLLRYWLNEGADRLAEFIARFWIPFAIAALWGAVNLGLYIYSNLDYASEREILTAYVEVWNEYLKLQEAETTEAQWKSFKEAAAPRLQPLVDELTSNTSSSTPIRRHLLWAGRDCLLPLVSTAGGERERRTEFGFQQHLNAIEQLMRGESPKPIRGAPRF